MQTSSLSEKVVQYVKPVVEGLGFSLVELQANRNKYNLHVAVVIYRPEGVSLNDCSLVHRTIQPRIEVAEDTRDVHIEVASPGIERKIKSNAEFALFSGKGVKIMLTETKEWLGGVIQSADDTGVRIRTGETTQEISYDQILKARLDYAQEVG